MPRAAMERTEFAPPCPIPAQRFEDVQATLSRLGAESIAETRMSKRKPRTGHITFVATQAQNGKWYVVEYHNSDIVQRIMK